MTGPTKPIGTMHPAHAKPAWWLLRIRQRNAQMGEPIRNPPSISIVRRIVLLAVAVILASEVGWAQPDAMRQVQELYNLAKDAVLEIQTDSGQVEVAPLVEIEKIRSGTADGILAGHVSLWTDSVIVYSGEGYAVVAGVFRTRLTSDSVVTRTYVVRFINDAGAWKLATGSEAGDTFIFYLPALTDQPDIVIERWLP